MPNLALRAEVIADTCGQLPIWRVLSGE